MLKRFFAFKNPDPENIRELERTDPDQHVAAVAHYILTRQDLFGLVEMELRAGRWAPTPNRSARVESRRRTATGDWISIRGSVTWFIQVRAFIDAAGD